MERKNTDGMNQYLEKMLGKMEESIKNLIKEVKDYITEVRMDLKKDIAEVKAEFSKATEELDSKVRQVTKMTENNKTMMQYRAIENHLRFRGIEEQEDEMIRVRMNKLLAEFLNQEPEHVNDKMDLVYTVNSA